jgi:hypothetical protein
MANSYPASGQVILDDLKVCTSARLQPHFVSYGEHMFMNLESAHNNSYLPVVTFSRAGCTLGAIGLERASNSDTVGSYAESEMIIGTRANTPTSIQTNGVRRMVITTAGNVNVQGGGILNIYRADNSRALQLYTTANETVIDSWESSSEPLHIRSMGIGGRIQFFTCATERMRISPAGNIGIGTQSPSMTLSIKGGKCGDVNEGQGQLLIDGDVAYNATNGSTLSASGAGSVIVFRGKYDTAGNITGFAGIAGSKENTTDGNYGGNLRFYTRTHGANNPKEWMRITNTGNIGIGTGIPDAKLHICNAVAGGTNNYSVIIQNACTVADARAGIAFSNNDQTPSAGGLSGASIQTSNNGIDGTGNLLFGTLLSGANTERMRISSNGNVGINTTTPGSYKLNVNGSFYSAGSSCEYKQSICQYNTDSCMFMKLKPVTYQYKDEWCHLGKELKSGTQIGLIAEDTAEVFPELAILKDEDDNKVVRNVDYEKLSIILLSEVQKLRKEVDNLKNNK